MTPEEFREAGHRLIDWISDYRAGIEQMPVRAQVAPGDIRNKLPDIPPRQPESLEALLDDLQDIVIPGITQVQHPMHFGWFPSNASLASVLGDITSSGLGTLGISWESCPALTEVEEVVCDWLRQLTGLSSQWEGTIHDTASTACLTALLVAREKASNFSENRGGLQADRNHSSSTAQRRHIHRSAKPRCWLVLATIIYAWSRLMRILTPCLPLISKSVLKGILRMDVRQPLLLRR